VVRITGYVKAALPGVAALSFVWGALYWWTLGFSAFSSYSHVALSAPSLPNRPPALVVTDQSGGQLRLFEPTGSYRLLSFGYLSCTGTCPLTIADFQGFHQSLVEQRLTNLQLFTITLAPHQDLPDALLFYWENLGSPKNWVFVTPGLVEREPYWESLRRMGMWVDRNELGQPVHDNRTFLLDPQGFLIHSFAGVPTLERVQAILAQEDK